MVNIVVLLVYIYISYSTFKYSRTVWKEGKRFAAACISLMALSLIVLPIAVLFYLS